MQALMDTNILIDYLSGIAGARHEGTILVTRNTRDFSADDPGVRVPYSLP